MRIHEKRWTPEGFGGGHWQERVAEHDGRRSLPENASEVPAETDLYDWRPIREQSEDPHSVAAASRGEE